MRRLCHGVGCVLNSVYVKGPFIGLAVSLGTIYMLSRTVPKVRPRLRVNLAPEDKEWVFALSRQWINIVVLLAIVLMMTFIYMALLLWCNTQPVVSK